MSRSGDSCVSGCLRIATQVQWSWCTVGAKWSWSASPRVKGLEFLWLAKKALLVSRKEVKSGPTSPYYDFGPPSGPGRVQERSRISRPWVHSRKCPEIQGLSYAQAILLPHNVLFNLKYQDFNPTQMQFSCSVLPTNERVMVWGHLPYI